MTLPSLSHVVRNDSTIEGLFSEDHPAVVNQTSGVVLLIAAYLAYRKKNGKSRETLRQESIWLAEFWDYLSSNSISCHTIIESDLVRYLDQGAKRDAAVVYLRPQDARVSFLKTLRRKRNVIYSFLFVLEHRLQLIQGVIGVKEPVRSGMLSWRNRVEPSLGVEGSFQEQDIRAAIRQNKERSRRERPTPSSDEAKKIRDAALEWVGTEMSAPTYYLIASLKSLGGARAGGACDLTGSSMTAAFLEEFHRPEYSKIKNLTQLCGSDPGNDATRRLIIDDLKNLQEKGRKFLFATVLEKGSRSRGLPISVDLFLEILDYIWSERANFIARRVETGKVTSSDFVFLSQETANALQPGSVGKIMKELFRRAGVPGSGHRLRATFAEDIVRDLYLRDRARHGQNYNVDAILMLAAEYMGHKDPQSLRPYINNILKQERAFEGEPVMFPEKDAPTMRIIAQALHEDGAEELRTLLNRIAKRIEETV